MHTSLTLLLALFPNGIEIKLLNCHFMMFNFILLHILILLICGYFEFTFSLVCILCPVV